LFHLTKLTRPNEAAAPVKALAREHTLEPVALLAIAAKPPADLAPGHANVANRHVGVGANVHVPAQLAHKRRAEPTDLGVALAPGIKLDTTLATAHVYCRGWNA